MFVMAFWVLNRLEFAKNTRRCYGHHFIPLHVLESLQTTSGLSILMHDVISLPDKSIYIT